MVAVQSAGPYLFELTHEDTKIEYIPGSRDGRPRLNYSGPMGRYSFEGDEIQTYQGARGLEISVTLDAVSHLRTNTLTFFVPDIELPHGRHALHPPARHDTAGRAAVLRAAGVRGPGAQLRLPAGRAGPALAGLALPGLRRVAVRAVHRGRHRGEEDVAARAGVAGAIVRSAGVAHAPFGGMHRLRRGLRHGRHVQAPPGRGAVGKRERSDGHRGHGSIDKDS
jgi:hypothetical protein